MLLKFIAGVFFVLAFMLPNHYFPWSSFYNDFAMALSLLCLMVMALWSLRQRTLTLPLVAGALLLVAIIPLLQVVTGLLYFNSDGWIASFYLFGLTLAYCAAYLLARQTSPQKVALLLAWAFLISAVLSVGVSLHQWLLLDGNIWLVDLPLRRWFPYGNLGQSTNVATLIVAACASLTYLHHQEKLSVVGSVVIALFLLFGAALMQQRTVIAMLPFILLWWVWRGRGGQTSLSFTALAAWLLCFVVFYGSIPSWTNAFHIDIGELKADAQLGVRSVFWSSLLHAVSERPWFGYGWNEVAVAQVSVAELYQGSIFVEHSHNILIDLLVWNGIPLGVLLIGGLGYWGGSRTVSCKSAESWFALTVIGCVMIHSLLEFPLDYAYFLIPVGLLAGLVDAQYQHRYRFRCPTWALAAATVAGAIFLVVLFKENSELEEDHREMRFASVSISGASPGASLNSVVMLDGPREFIRYALTLAKPEMTEEEIEWMRKVAYRNAYPPALFRYILALAFNNKQDDACVVLQKLKSFDYDGTMYPEAVRNLELMEGSYPQLVGMCSPTNILPGQHIDQ